MNYREKRDALAIGIKAAKLITNKKPGLDILFCFEQKKYLNQIFKASFKINISQFYNIKMKILT